MLVFIYNFSFTTVDKHTRTHMNMNENDEKSSSPDGKSFGGSCASDAFLVVNCISLHIFLLFRIYNTHMAIIIIILFSLSVNVYFYLLLCSWIVKCLFEQIEGIYVCVFSYSKLCKWGDIVNHVKKNVRKEIL